MSVAFRRESDEEHKEPRFELPIPPGPNPVTERGLALIAGRIAELTEAIAATRDEAGLAEAKRDLRYWAARHATALIAPLSAGKTAMFGSIISYRLDGQDRQTVAIVGHDEADPASGRIAFTSPIARALIGAIVGDWVDFAGREEAIEVLEVGPIR